MRDGPRRRCIAVADKRFLIPFKPSEVSLSLTASLSPHCINSISRQTGRRQRWQQDKDTRRRRVKAKSGSASCLVRSNENFLGYSGCQSWLIIHFRTAYLFIYLLLYLFPSRPQATSLTKVSHWKSGKVTLLKNQPKVFIFRKSNEKCHRGEGMACCLQTNSLDMTWQYTTAFVKLVQFVNLCVFIY